MNVIVSCIAIFTVGLLIVKYWFSKLSNSLLCVYLPVAIFGFTLPLMIIGWQEVFYAWIVIYLLGIALQFKYPILEDIYHALPLPHEYMGSLFEKEL